MEFTKDHTQAAKGLAILLMYIHHLFTFPRRILDGNSFISLFPSIRIEYEFGYASVICVGMFLFLSGYGLYKSFNTKKKRPIQFIIHRLWNFYQVYWFYFLIFIPIGLIFYRDVTLFRSDVLRYNFNFLEFIQNLTGISSSYNGEWWFVWVYIVLIIIFPLILFLIERVHIVILIFSVFLYFSPFAIASYSGPDPGALAYWQLVFITGIFFSKFNLFEMINPKYMHLLNSIMLVFICLLFRRRGVPDFILVPPLIISSISIFNKSRHLKTLMIFLGNYSFPMWLIHTFFCYYYFQRFIYWPKISILVLMNLLLVTIGVVVLAESLRLRLMKLLQKNISKHSLPDCLQR